MKKLYPIKSCWCPTCNLVVTHEEWLSATITYEYSRGELVEITAEIGCDICGDVFVVHQSTGKDDLHGQ
jgi:hypothetical protein